MTGQRCRRTFVKGPTSRALLTSGLYSHHHLKVDPTDRAEREVAPMTGMVEALMILFALAIWAVVGLFMTNKLRHP